MERSDDINFRAAEACLRSAIPFCIYRLPGAGSPVAFFANPSGCPSGSGPSFFIGRWNEKSKSFHRIHAELTASEILGGAIDMSPKELEGYRGEPSTDREEYLKGINRVIDAIVRRDLGKVVVSRVANVSVAEAPEFYAVLARRLFYAFPGAFRYLYYTPLTGAWIGASPELLLSYSKESGHLDTMALAGTRRATDGPSCAPWDGKNLREHTLVKDFIASNLQALGLKINVHPTVSLRTGDIEHLSTPIESEIDSPSPLQALHLVDELNPTPALCGFPREDALDIIEATERHSRQCYGGVVGIDDDRRLMAFVNLRCAALGNHDMTLYAGGGILRESVPENEWEETERKLQAITDFL